MSRNTVLRAAPLGAVPGGRVIGPSTDEWIRNRTGTAARFGGDGPGRHRTQGRHRRPRRSLRGASDPPRWAVACGAVLFEAALGGVCSWSVLARGLQAGGGGLALTRSQAVLALIVLSAAALPGLVRSPGRRSFRRGRRGIHE